MLLIQPGLSGPTWDFLVRVYVKELWDPGMASSEMGTAFKLSGKSVIQRE